MSVIAKLGLGLLAAIALLGALAAASPLRVMNALTAKDTYRKSANVAYGADPRQRLDVYSPSRQSEALAPVVVFFYGGNWNSGDRGDYAFVGEALAARGMVAVVADYRLYPQVRYPSFLEDGALAVSWAADQAAAYGGDPQRLFVMGHSAGAYNAAMLALDRRWLTAARPVPVALRGWIGMAGPYDFIPIKNEVTRPVFFYPDTPPDSQPINHVAADAPPALLIASTHDDLVDPIRNTGGLAKLLRAARVHLEEVYVSTTAHTTLIATLWWPLRGVTDVLDRIERFVKSDGGRSPGAQ